MKTSIIALASVVGTVFAGSGRTVKLGKQKLRRGEPAAEALLQKARPYKKKGNSSRRLDEEAEIDGSYSLKFSQCVDVKTLDEDLFDENIISYAQDGRVVSSKSYVLFHVCQGSDCYYESDDDLYIVDLSTYMKNVALYYANMRNDYCEACNQFEDYCNPAEDDAEDVDADADEDANEDADEDADANEDADEDADADEDGDEADGERKLKQKPRRTASKQKSQRRAKSVIDCDKCDAYNCYEDQENLDDGQQTQEEIDNDVAEWIAGLAECQETGEQWDETNLYVSAMCSPYGDGVELAVFMNEDCTMYTNLKAFKDVYDPYYNNDNNYNVNYVSYAEKYIKTAFSETMPCLEEEFADPEENEDDDAGAGDDEEYQLNDYCAQIFNEGAADFNNCEGDENGEDNDDGANDDQYKWYTFDMKADDAENVEDVCYTLNQMAGEYSHIYDESTSGTWYKRNKSGQIIAEGDSKKKGISGGSIALIVLLCAAIVGAAGFALKQKKGGSAAETEYQGGTLS